MFYPHPPPLTTSELTLANSVSLSWCLFDSSLHYLVLYTPTSLSLSRAPGQRHHSVLSDFLLLFEVHIWTLGFLKGLILQIQDRVGHSTGAVVWVFTSSSVVLSLTHYYSRSPDGLPLSCVDWVSAIPHLIISICFGALQHVACLSHESTILSIILLSYIQVSNFYAVIDEIFEAFSFCEVYYGVFVTMI